jgi:hypothetical protein
VFDQDGTLWVEHPMYSQMMYCLDRVPVLATQKPALRMRSRSRPCSRWSSCSGGQASSPVVLIYTCIVYWIRGKVGKVARGY